MSWSKLLPASTGCALHQQVKLTQGCRAVGVPPHSHLGQRFCTCFFRDRDKALGTVVFFCCGSLSSRPPFVECRRIDLAIVGTMSCVRVVVLCVALCKASCAFGIARHSEGFHSEHHLRHDRKESEWKPDPLPKWDPVVFQLQGNVLERLDTNLAGSSNPKNGTPWFRYKEVDSRGTAEHVHFGGLHATGEFQPDVLRAHNMVRERAGIAPLQWSNILEELASSHAHTMAHDGCYIKHSSFNERYSREGFSYIGENLYKVINMKPTGVDVVDAWYAEIVDYTYGPVGQPCTRRRCAERQTPPCMLGHFTQVMWAASSAVGCARAECPAEPNTFIAICNYGEGGNVVGSVPFSVASAQGLDLEANFCDPSDAYISWYHLFTSLRSAASPQCTWICVILVGTMFF